MYPVRWNKVEQIVYEIAICLYDSEAATGC